MVALREDDDSPEDDDVGKARAGFDSGDDEGFAESDASDEPAAGADFYPWTCEVCGEVNEVFVEPDAGAHQELVEDCSVCCRPHTILVRVGRGGRVSVSARSDG
jgi:hypothetical protein